MFCVTPATITVWLSLLDSSIHAIPTVDQLVQRIVQSVQTIIHWFSAVSIITECLAVTVIGCFLNLLLWRDSIFNQMVLSMPELIHLTMNMLCVLGMYLLIILLVMWHTDYLMLEFSAWYEMISTADTRWFHMSTPLCLNQQSLAQSNNCDFVHRHHHHLT